MSQLIPNEEGLETSDQIPPELYDDELLESDTAEGDEE